MNNRATRIQNVPFNHSTLCHYALDTARHIPLPFRRGEVVLIGHRRSHSPPHVKQFEHLIMSRGSVNKKIYSALLFQPSPHHRRPTAYAPRFVVLYTLRYQRPSDEDNRLRYRSVERMKRRTNVIGRPCVEAAACCTEAGSSLSVVHH